jgi:hypothetical protein
MLQGRRAERSQPARLFRRAIIQSLIGELHQISTNLRAYARAGEGLEHIGRAFRNLKEIVPLSC